MLYLYIGGILASEAAAFAALKQYTLTKNSWLFALAVAMYGLVCFFLTRAFAFKDIGIVNVLWSVFSIIAVISVGVFAFHESLSWREVAGVVLAAAGVAVLGGR